MSPTSLLLRAIAWLNKESASIGFGTVGISVKIHAGKVCRVERTITESVKSSPETPAEGPDT